MLTFCVTGGGRTPVSIRHVWFATAPRQRDALLPTIYFHTRDPGLKPGFQRRSRWTSIVRIDREEVDLLAGFSRNTRYKIQRAAREEPQLCVRHCDPSRPGTEARQGSLPLRYEDNLVTRSALLDGGEEISHQYIVDHQLQRVHLYTSQSRYQEIEDRGLRDRIGRANRWLHFNDMLHFRDKGFKYYDFGGYARAQTGTKLGNIDNLKQGFRGELIEENIFISWSIIAYNRLIYARPTTA